MVSGRSLGQTDWLKVSDMFVSFSHALDLFNCITLEKMYSICEGNLLAFRKRTLLKQNKQKNNECYSHCSNSTSEN